MTMRNVHQRAKLVLQQVLDGCSSLKDSPSELWKVYLLKFLDSYAYFSFSILFTLFLSHDFGYSDVTAGTIYGAWGGFITIYGLATGVLVDTMGVAKSLRLGFLCSFVSRCLLFTTTSRGMLWFNIGCLLPLGNCLGIPVLTIGIRRYTTVQNRGFAYGLFYVIMNVAALVSGPVVDICNGMFHHNHEQDDGTDNSNKNVDNQNTTSEEGEYAPKEWEWNQYRMVLFTGIIANALAVLVTFTIREIKLQEDPSVIVVSAEDDRDTTEDSNSNASVENQHNSFEKDATSAGKDSGGVSTFTPLQGSARSILQETLQTESFWRFLVVCLITLNVRMIFRHLDATLPKYMVREFGEQIPYGTIYAINPAIIMILVPIMTAATSHMEPLVMIHIGSYISAASVFFLSISTSIPACILFVVVLSIGEATWSPRLYDYTMSVCQEGREGTYMALSSAPLFLAKLPVGFMSGYLLQEFCPSEGERRSKLMWLIIGVTTASSPIFMTVFWKYISHKDDVGHGTGDSIESPNSRGRYTELTPNPQELPPTE